MEAMVRAEDRLRVVVAAPGACIGPWDLRVGTSALLVGVARGLDPVYPEGQVGLVDARDVGRALATLATMPSPPDRVLLVGSNHRLSDLMARVARRFGVPRPRPPLSCAAAVKFADAEEARAAAEGGRPRLSREIVDLVLQGAVIDASLSERALGLAYTPVDDTIDTWAAWARRVRILDPIAAEAT
jgi:nucleoside-diphosphate-sugar epimerase